MPLGIISSDEFDLELNNCSSNGSLINPISPRSPELIDSDSNPADINLEQIPTAEVININSGRGSGNTQVPSAIRKVLGETSAINSRKEALELADMFGISKSSVSAYNAGAHSTASINSPDNDTKSHIDASKLRVSTRARKKLNLALTHITEEKLAEAKVGEIASVAKAMAGVIKDMEPSTDNDKNKSNTPFVVFAPVIMSENKFETINVSDDY